MEKLNVKSSLIGTRYKKDIFIPDFIRSKNGKIDFSKCLEKMLLEEYGYVDLENLKLEVCDVTDRIMDKWNGNLIANKAKHDKLLFKFSKDNKESSFIVDVYIPTNIHKDKLKMAVYYSFNKYAPNKHCPLEEIIDMGLGVAHIYYNGITSDDNDFTNGLANLIVDRNKKYAGGKLSVWAYAGYRVGQYLLDNNYCNAGNLYVLGHSRLGKTSLLTCALYNIFAGCFVNCSGAGGVAIFNEKEGETIKNLTDVMPCWFVPDFNKYNEKDNELPFDQHYLIASIFPRKIFVTCGSEDKWADLDAQYFACQCASIAYRENGLMGMEDKDILVGEKNDKGEIKFFKRKGQHFLSREDWKFYIENAYKD